MQIGQASQNCANLNYYKNKQKQKTSVSPSAIRILGFLMSQRSCILECGSIHLQRVGQSPKYSSVWEVFGWHWSREYFMRFPYINKRWMQLVLTIGYFLLCNPIFFPMVFSRRCVIKCLLNIKQFEWAVIISSVTFYNHLYGWKFCLWNPYWLFFQISTSNMLCNFLLISDSIIFVRYRWIALLFLQVRTACAL